MVCMAVKFNELRCIKNKLTKYDGDRSLQVSNSQGSLASYKIWKKCFYFQTENLKLESFKLHILYFMLE